MRYVENTNKKSSFFLTNMPIQPLWLTYFIEILLVLEFQLTKTYFGTFSYKAHFRPQISSNAHNTSKDGDILCSPGHLLLTLGADFRKKLRRKRKRRAFIAGILEDQRWRFPVECRGTMPLNGFGESEEAN